MMKLFILLITILIFNIKSFSINEKNYEDYYDLAKKIQRTNKDSSLKILHDLVEFAREKQKANMYLLANKQIAVTHYFSYELDSAIKYFEKTIDFAKKNKDTKNVAAITNLLANAYRKKSDFLKALDSYNFSLKKYEEVNDTLGRAFVYNNIALTYLKMLSYNKSIENFNRSLELKMLLNDSSAMAKTLGNIGLTLVEYGDKSLAVEYYEESFDILRELNDTINIPIILNHLADANLSLKKYKVAEDYYRRSLSYSQKNNQDLVAASSLFGLANMSLETGDLYAAENYANESERIFKRLKSEFELASLYLLMAKIKKRHGLENQFYNYFKYANRIIEKNDFKKLKLNAYELGYQFFEKIGNFDEALGYYKKYSKMKEQINDQEFRLSRANLEFEMKEKLQKQRILTVEDQKSLLEDKVKTQKRFMYIVFIFFISLLVVLVYVLKIFFEKKKLNEKLEDSIKAKNKFFSIIAHDLKGPLSAFKILTSQMRDYFDEFSEQEKMEFTSEISQQAEYLHKLLENLLTWSRIETKDLKFFPDKFDLKFLVDNIIERNNKVLNLKEISISSDLKDEIIVYFDIHGLDIVISNIISNAIKYSNLKSTINIYLEKSINHLVLTIEDEGIGISKAVLENIENPKSRITKLGTKGETGTGLGIILSKAIMEENGGDIEFYSKLDVGTKVDIKIPKEN